MKTRTKKDILVLVVSFFWIGSASGQEMSSPSLQILLPGMPGWSLTEPPRLFSPGSLFEYINGAAENYLSYGFQELAVGDFKKDGSEAALTVEIYDMGEETRAFGIYSSERYPESRFLDIGGQGYIEDGTLNFFVGGYYIKLFCFDCGDEAEAVLRSAAEQVEKKAAVKTELPPVLRLFPREGLVSNSERFILQNVLGFGFLHHGYLADYHAQGQEFELFIIQGTSPRDAQDMFAQYLESQRKAGQPPQSVAQGYLVKDRYSHNIFLAIKGDLILGVMRIKGGNEELGEKYLQWLVESAAR